MLEIDQGTKRELGRLMFERSREVQELDLSVKWAAIQLTDYMTKQKGWAQGINVITTSSEGKLFIVPGYVRGNGSWQVEQNDGRVYEIGFIRDTNVLHQLLPLYAWVKHSIGTRQASVLGNDDFRLALARELVSDVRTTWDRITEGIASR